MREIRTSGSLSGEWSRGMVRYSGTGNRKGQHQLWLTYTTAPLLDSTSRPQSGSFPT
jgi:hypothetical protein